MEKRKRGRPAKKKEVQEKEVSPIDEWSKRRTSLGAVKCGGGFRIIRKGA